MGLGTSAKTKLPQAQSMIQRRRPRLRLQSKALLLPGDQQGSQASAYLSNDHQDDNLVKRRHLRLLSTTKRGCLIPRDDYYQTMQQIDAD
jgi:hypothetical protein